MAQSKVVQSGFTRAWITVNATGPLDTPVYFGELKVDDPSRSFGDIESIEIPDPARFDAFLTAGSIRGASERATFGLTGRYPRDKSKLLEYANLGCRIDIQVHVGACKNPQAYDTNWDKIVVFPDGRITSYSIEGFGAIDSSERAATNESVELSSGSMYEIARLTFAQLETVNITEIVRDVSVYGSLGCADCDEVFSGCVTVFAVQDGGLATRPMILFSNDGFATSGTDFNTEFAVADTIADATFVGTSYVMISETANANDGGISWISIEDALTGTAGWQSPAVNPFNNPNTPVKIYSKSPADTLMVGRNGYVWKMSILGTVVEIDAGNTTTEDLVSIDMFDRNRVLIGGTNNTLVYSVDGGAILSPSPTVPVAEAANTVTAVHMVSETDWLIGYSSGSVYASKNAGISWTEKMLPINPTAINGFAFSDDTVGVMIVTVGGAGSLLRTTNKGYSWRVMPDGLGTLPTSVSLLSAAMCHGEANVVYAAGEGTVNGILIKGTNVS